MQFIASKNIVHRDLAARNVLITDDFNAKISDFGLSFCTNDKNIEEDTLPKKLPVKWLSLEALIEHVFSEKSDVWAFGVLMYEVFSFGKVPYPDLKTIGEIVGFLSSEERPACPEAANEEIYGIMMDCWREDPESRPNFDYLVHILRGILERSTASYGYLETKNE